jgi:C4-dicarboxylate-specific signal transduction histidine kinase
VTTTETPTAAFLEEARKRFYRAGTSTSLVRNLESWIDSANDVPYLLALVESVREHRRRAEERAEQAEAKVAEIRALCETPGINVMGTDIIAILSPEES